MSITWYIKINCRINIQLYILGNYFISLTYNGAHINGSPYHLSLCTQPSQEQVVPLPSIPIRAFIEPLEFYVRLLIYIYKLIYF